MFRKTWYSSHISLVTILVSLSKYANFYIFLPRCSSIVLLQCVIPAAQTLVNSHATGTVSSSCTEIWLQLTTLLYKLYILVSEIKCLNWHSLNF